jgi:hypothetical protein
LSPGRLPLRKPPKPASPAPRPLAVAPGIDPDLAEALELACLDEMRGDTFGPGLARRLERAVGDELRRAGLVPVAVKATSDRTGTRLTVLLPGPNQTVREVVLRVG